MIAATQLRVGMIVKEGNDLFRVTYAMHRTPGNLRAFIQVKLKNVTSGMQLEKRYSSVDKVEKANLEYRDFEYLYESGDEFFFMDTKTHDQISFMRDNIGDLNLYLTPNQLIQVMYNDDKPMGVELPLNVVLKVESTVPGLRTATASASTKPATMETGLVVQVPQFVNEGDTIKINTADNSYLERVKK